MLDSLAQQVLDNEAERRRRKGPGFSVITNPQNPPAPWNDMQAELTLILSPSVRMRLGLGKTLKSGRKTRSSAA